MAGVVGMRVLRAALSRRGIISHPSQRMRLEATVSAHHRGNLQRLGRAGSRAFSSQSNTNVAVADETTERLLAQSLADREVAQALAHFNRLETPPSQLLSQKLAILLAKRGNLQQTERAVEILRSVYLRPSLQPDDYTKLASIYVVDACLRHRLLDQALEIHEEAFNVGVALDLPAYDALVQALVASDRLDHASDLLEDISSANDMSPTERSYFPLLEALVERQDYQTATTLLELARTRGAKFTSETFQPLVEIADGDEDATDSIVTFLSYVEQVWDDVKMFDELADSLDDADVDGDDYLGGHAVPLTLTLEDENDDDDEFK